jgi:hypothetical protein
MPEVKDPNKVEPRDIYQLDGEERNEFYLSQGTLGGSSGTIDLRPSTALPGRSTQVDFRKMPHQKKPWQATSTPNMWGTKLGLDLGIVGHRANVYQTVLKYEYPEIAIPPNGKRRFAKEARKPHGIKPPQHMEEPEWFGESISQRSAKEKPIEHHVQKKVVPSLHLPGSVAFKMGRPMSAAPNLKSNTPQAAPITEIAKPTQADQPVIIETGPHLEGATVPV